MSRQNYYVGRKRRRRREVDGDLVAELVRVERRSQPRLGTRKLKRLLKGALAEAGVEIGRDRMFDELKQRDLLVKKLPRRQPRTTQSRHTLRVMRNEIKGRVFLKPNEVWMADLTYLRTAEGYLYASLITDKVSRKIVGYHVGESLESIGCVQALEMALADLPEGCRPIHHSDRGCQYCCHEYIGRLEARALPISMTETDHCAENALAERVNGILKGEYQLGGEFRTKESARLAVDQAIYCYNHKRPHTALGYEFPAVVHRQAA